MYEVLKQIRDEVSSLRQGQAELKAEMQALRGHMVAMQQDTQNIYTILVRHETRLDRIDRRLELVEPASA
jgi:chromosome segregation ATPase